MRYIRTHAYYILDNEHKELSKLKDEIPCDIGGNLNTPHGKTNILLQVREVVDTGGTLTEHLYESSHIYLGRVLMILPLYQIRTT